MTKLHTSNILYKPQRFQCRKIQREEKVHHNFTHAENFTHTENFVHQKSCTEYSI